MIIKGKARGGPIALANHLLSKENDRTEVIELRGVAARDLKTALLEIDLVGTGTESQRPFYHANISPDPGEQLTPAQRDYAIDRLELELGLKGQPRTVVEHEKDGRTHWHVVWSRVDLERMAMISDSHNYRKHELVARELERTFGHERVQGAHVEREDTPRPERTPSHAEMQQAKRTSLTPQETKAWATELWRATDGGQAFVAAIAEQGWMLARGDRRDFVLVDPFGETHSLARRIEGLKAAEVRARMADVDAARLPSVEEARAAQKARRQERGGLAIGTPSSPLVSQIERQADEAQRRLPGHGDRPPVFAAVPRKVAGTKIRGGDGGPPPADREPGTRSSPGSLQEGAPAALSASKSEKRAGQGMAARAIGGMAYGFGKAVGALAEAVGNMLAPPPPLTPDQQERAERVAEERAEKKAARTAAVAKDEERVVAERAGQPGVAPATPQEIHQQLLEQMARANAARDRDRDEDRGRERTR